MVRFLTLTAAAALFATSAVAQAQFEGDVQRGGADGLNAGMGVTHSGSDHSEASPGGMQSRDSGDWRSGGEGGYVSGGVEGGAYVSGSVEADDGGLFSDDADDGGGDFAFNTDACSRPHYINLAECKSGGLVSGRASAQSDVSDPQEGTVGSSQPTGRSSGGSGYGGAGDGGGSTGGGSGYAGTGD